MSVEGLLEVAFAAACRFALNFVRTHTVCNVK